MHRTDDCYSGIGHGHDQIYSLIIHLKESGMSSSLILEEILKYRLEQKYLLSRILFRMD